MIKLKKKQLKLEYVYKQDKAFDCIANIKVDAYSLPSKFYAITVFYPKTPEESQTFLTKIEADAYHGKNCVGSINKTDEFDTARAAKKWIKQEFAEFIKILKKE